MARHRAARGRSRLWIGVASVLVTGAVVGAGVGLVPPQATPPVTAAVTAPAPADVPARTQGSARAPVTVLEPLPTDALPEDSGEGRRVVFSEESQRVWLVGEGDRVERTYLVSGSLTDNLQPGTYAVYSRSERAWGIDDSGTMRHFVRFTRGARAAIGFHDIPVSGGRPLQTEAELGTPQSHGCIRQSPEDAVALWDFAPLGTTVVVVP